MMSVRRRLLILLLPALAILMLVGGFADYLIAVATTRNAYDQALASTAVAAAAYLRLENGELRFTPSARAVAALRADSAGATLYSIIGPKGELLAGAAQLPTAAGAARTGVNNLTFRDAEFQGRELRVATLLTPTDVGPAKITVATTVETRARAQRVMLLGKLLVDFAELDITLLLVWIGVYYGLRPLRALQEQVGARSPRELQRFNETQVPGEVRPLVTAFNRLLELLHDAALSQHRFVADAAHQMRTPVAGLLAQLELLLQAPGAAAVKAELLTVNRGIQHLAHSANQLLALARAEPFSALPENFQSIPLQPLVEQAVERNIDRAEKGGLDLGAEAAAASVIGDAWLLDDLLGNLIDNALKYTPSRGHVTVRCGVLDGCPFLEVEDDGPGIPESERLRVRERFYRRPGSAGMGCGLGLAIVEEISRVHKAAFTIESGANGRGTRMKVLFRRQTT
jgi:two-component system sensor histidine kinase TctE